MAGLVLSRKGAVQRILAASLLAWLTGCATPPESPASASPAPLTALTPSLEITTAPVAKVELPSVPSRLSALARRLLDRFRRPPPPAATTEPQPDSEGVVDEKYRLTGDAALELDRGDASWYGGRFHGQRTASGERYDKYALTAAHKTLPFGTIVRVRSLTLGREVNVRINDRGPFAPGRVIDVSQAAADALGLRAAGMTEVSLNLAESGVEELGTRPPHSRAHSAKDRGHRKSRGHSAKSHSGQKSASAKKKRR